MVHTAAMASPATHLAVDSEGLTAKASRVLLPALDLALRHLLALLGLEAQPAVLPEQDLLQGDRAPAAAAVLHPVRRKLYVH